MKRYSLRCHATAVCVLHRIFQFCFLERNAPLARLINRSPVCARPATESAHSKEQGNITLSVFQKQAKLLYCFTRAQRLLAERGRLPIPPPDQQQLRSGIVCGSCVMKRIPH